MPTRPIVITNPKNHDAVTFLQTSRTTGGTLTQLEVSLGSGGRNALHFHKTFSERFEALEGTLSLATAEGTITLAPGESFVAAPFVEHSFFNDGEETIRFQVEIRPANERFECFLQVAYGLINDRWTLPGGFPLNPLYLGILYALGDTHYKGPLYWLSPFAALLSRLATALGVEGRLLQKYCQTLSLPLLCESEEA